MKKAFAILSLCVLLFSCSSNGGGDDTIIDPCGRPTSISTVNITIESVTVNWSSSETGASYEIQYGETGFTLGSGQVTTASGNSTTISGLTEGTTYQFYIRSNCGGNDFSDWAGPISVTTSMVECPEAGNLGAFSITENSAFVGWSWNSTLTPTWVVEYGPTGFTPGTGTELNSSFDSLELTGLTPSTTYDFYVTSKCSSTNFGPRVGPVSFTTEDLCSTPTNVQVGSIQNCEVELYWSENGETAFQVEYGVSGFTLGQGTVVNTSNSSGFVISDLNPGTTYEVYVRANCGSDGFSDYSDPAIFTTETQNIPGTWTVDMNDSWGDGWQTDDTNGGSGILVTMTHADGTETSVEIGMCSSYTSAQGTFLGGSNCTTGVSNATATVDVPSTVIDIDWYFPGDFHDEISFQIYRPSGNLALSVAQGQDAGSLDITYCNN